MIKLTFNQLEAIYMLAKAQSKGSEWELTAEVQMYAPFADKLSSAYLNNSLLYTPKYFEPIKINPSQKWAQTDEI